MEFMEAVKARRSYRGKFTDERIPRKDLEEILEAGFLAPSGCNLQTSQFIGVDDPELVRELAEIYGPEWALTSTAAVLILTKETMSPSGVSYHVHDYSAAAENIGLAAADKGYGTVWVEGQIRGEKAERMKQLLGVPDDLYIAIYMPMGVPAAEQPQPKKKPIENRVWFNRYGER